MWEPWTKQTHWANNHLKFLKPDSMFHFMTFNVIQGRVVKKQPWKPKTWILNNTSVFDWNNVSKKIHLGPSHEWRTHTVAIRRCNGIQNNNKITQFIKRFTHKIGKWVEAQLMNILVDHILHTLSIPDRHAIEQSSINDDIFNRSNAYDKDGGNWKLVQVY